MNPHRTTNLVMRAHHIAVREADRHPSDWLDQWQETYHESLRLLSENQDDIEESPNAD